MIRFEWLGSVRRCIENEYHDASLPSTSCRSCVQVVVKASNMSDEIV